MASGRDHALVPFAVGHESAIVVGSSALVGLLLSPVQHSLKGLALAFGSAFHIAGRRGSVPVQQSEAHMLMSAVLQLLFLKSTDHCH